jgi:transposase
LIHSGIARPRDRFLWARHQTCLAHLLRRCHELLAHVTRGAVLFPRKVQGLLQEALATRDQRDAGTLTLAQTTVAADLLDQRMETLLKPIKSNPANERLAKHVWKHRRQLFTFLRQKGIDATNYRAEQAIRPAVVNRKVWGGNRTEAGTEAQSILMTILQTAVVQGRQATEFLATLLQAPAQRQPWRLAGSG